MSRAALIGLDWGTSSLRAYRIDADGAVLARREADAGILRVPEGDFERAFQDTVGDWLEGSVPVLAAGMIGSRQGWREAPYLACPADLAALGGALLPVQTRRGETVHLVPGLSFEGEDGIPDVMRGEETQILGARTAEKGDQLFLLPGTHSKWAVVAGGRVTRFRTMMTGEVFAALRDHTILGRLMTEHAEDPEAFARGVRLAGREGAGLLGRLFSVRTLGLFEKLPGSSLASYLSGLLIGSEIEEARAWVAGAPVTIIGASKLAERYHRGLTLAGVAAEPGPEDAAARGLHRIARAAGLIA